MNDLTDLQKLQFVAPTSSVAPAAIAPAAWHELFQVLNRAKQELRDAIANITESMGMGVWSALVLIACHQTNVPVCQSRLAQALNISPAQISSIVEALRKNQWVVGQRSEVDRRRQVWQTTDAGRRVAVKLMERIATETMAGGNTALAQELYQLHTTLHNMLSQHKPPQSGAA